MQSLEDKPLLAAWILRAKCERFTGLAGKAGAPPAACSAARGHCCSVQLSTQEGSNTQHVHAWLVQLILFISENKAGYGNLVYLLCSRCILKA